MKKRAQVIICDCDHHDIEPEQRVLDAAGITYKRLQCTNEEEVIDQCSGASVLINQYVRMNAKVFRGLPDLKQIVRYGVGVDNINIGDANEFGIQVCNVPDYGMMEVADHAVSLMLALVRKTYIMANNTRCGGWDYTYSIPVHRLSTMTVGIVGMGRIGKEFAKRAHSFGFSIIAYDPLVDNLGSDFWYVNMLESFDELLKQSDIISIHCSLSKQNYHMFNEVAFNTMRQNSFLINVSRGGLVDETALDKALTNGKLMGVGIDVVNQEPLAKYSPLRKHENCLITPHMAWYSEEAQQELKRKVAEEAVRFLSGEKVKYPINQL